MELTRARRTRGSYLRTKVVALTCVAVTVAFGLAIAGPVRAQEPFENGRSKAHAQVMRVAPGVGNLELAVTTGETTTEVVNSLAQALAQSTDLGLIASSLVSETCDGREATIKEEQLPQPTQVDNRSGDQSVTNDDMPLAGEALGGGRETAEATKQPSSHASVSNVSTALGPLATLSGGRSDSSTRIVDGEAREAVATASTDLDIAGVVSLRGLQWRAFHRTGADPAVEGGFSVEGANAGGQPLPTDPAPLQEALNAALAPSGVTVEMPRVEHLTEPNELMRVTPMRITLRDSPLGRTVVGPVLNLTRAQREQLFNALIEAWCYMAGVLLVGEIAISPVAGTGFLVVEIGGVEATTSAGAAGNPFGTAPEGFGEVTPAIPAATSSGFGSTPGSPSVAATPGTPGVAPSGEAVATSPIGATADGPMERICESLHQSGGRCTAGAALPIGLAGLALTAGVAYLDWRQRRGVLDAALTPDATDAGAATS